MDKIRAPYNFVPVAEQVYFPERSEQVSQDVPFREGLSGRLPYRIVAETPIFVRGEGGSSESGSPSATFFRTPDGAYAIPGSSVRGMLRSVVEIASFGKLARVNDHTWGVRDLDNRDVYGQYMSEIREISGPSERGTKKPMPLVSAGWLRKLTTAERSSRPENTMLVRDEDDAEVVAEIAPCDFYKIEYKQLSALAERVGCRGFSPERKQSAPSKYDRWGAPSLDVEVHVQALRKRGQKSQQGVPFLGDAGRVVDGGILVQGRLVFTGQPMEWRADAAPRRSGAGKAKHHDFVFSPRPEAARAGAQTLPVTRAQLRVFEFVHADRGQQNRLQVDPNPEWKHWKAHYDKHTAVPVFVLPERDGSLRAFGLAMMFRLPYRHGVLHAVGVAQPEHDDPRYDLAEVIFGHVPLDRRTRNEANTALKGRVSVGLATARSDQVRPGKRVNAVLGAPKASYYPNYIEQSDDRNNPGADPPPTYRTFMDDDARVRGWKRYRPHDPANLPPVLPPKASSKVGTTFEPLDAGTVFEGVIRLHNLRPAELGALVWAARWGGDPNARHTLGMARSLGFGRVRLEVQLDTPLVANDGQPFSLDECERAFVDLMESWANHSKVLGGWRASLQIESLLACAMPFAEVDDGRHMQLDHPVHRNEFSQAKKDKLALRPALDVAAWRARTLEAPRAPVPVATTTVRGTIRRFGNNQVWLEIEGGRKEVVRLNTDTFKGFKALNGNELRSNRPVMVSLQGDVVVRVEPV